MNLDKSFITNDIKEFLKHFKKSTISLDELYDIVSDLSGLTLSDLKISHTESFRTIIETLIKEEVISKRGKKTDGIGYNPLNLSYNNLLKEKKETLTEEEKLFLHSLNKDIDVNSYFKNVNLFRSDREKLKILSDYLNNISENTTFMGVNERSYELFGYEKELVNEKKGLLTRAKVDVEKLKCFPQYTPLQCHIFKNFYNKDSRVILIVENLNTYNSLLTAAIKTKLGTLIDMIIYGGGNMISGNFKQHLRYDIDNNDSIYYFGDIDPEGLDIYKRVKTTNSNLNIKLCNDLYRLAIKRGKIKGIHDIHNTNQSMPSNEEVDTLLKDLDKDVSDDFKNIIYNGKYIPQEAVNYDILLSEIENI